MNLYGSLYKLVCDPATTANAFTAGQITRFQPDPGFTRVLATAGGARFPSFVGTRRIAPRFSFECTDVASVLAENSAAALYNGLLIDSDVSHPGLTAYFPQRQQGGGFQSGANHITATIADGTLILDSLSVAGGDDATLAGRVIATSSDGTTAPLAIATSQALPAGDPAVTTLYTLGPSVIGGAELSGVQRWTLATNTQEVARMAGGSVYETFSGLASGQPILTLDTLHGDAWNSYKGHGTLQTSANCYLYLRKRDRGGAFVADGTAEHVKITFQACQIAVSELTDSEGDLVTRIALAPVLEGANPILAVDTTLSLIHI